MEQQLKEITSKTQTQEERLAEYERLLAAALSIGTTDDLKRFFRHILNEEVSLNHSRRILGLFSDIGPSTLQRKFKLEDIKSLYIFLIEWLEIRPISFEDYVSKIRLQLAEVYEDDENWSKACEVLMQIPVESGHRTISNEIKLVVYLKIATHLLRDHHISRAESFLSKAAVLVPPSAFDKLTELDKSREIETTREKIEIGLITHFRHNQAKLFDFKRKFLEASPKYHQVSFSYVFPLSEKKRILENAIITAILGAAGPQRSRLLATLYKDDRVKPLPIFVFLEKMYMERILRPEEVKDLSSYLQPHHRATMSDDLTVFERAVMEHNLLCASKIYVNIRFEELGRLLGIDGTKAEKMASKMIAEKRMEGTMDQVEQLLYFRPRNRSTAQWDETISATCQHLSELAMDISSRFPELVIQR